MVTHDRAPLLFQARGLLLWTQVWGVKQDQGWGSLSSCEGLGINLQGTDVLLC